MKAALLAVVVGLTLVLFQGNPVEAATCTVPGSHSAIQEAVLDSACTEVVLMDRTYFESVSVERTIVIEGPATGGAIVQGLVKAADSGTQLTLKNIQVNNSCSPEALAASDGAEIVGEGLIVIWDAGLPCPPVVYIFLDGFESGNTLAWSSREP